MAIDWTGTLETVKTIGALLAFVVLFFQLRDYWKNRVDVIILVKQRTFETYNMKGFDSEPTTRLMIEADIRNIGLQPTTIAEVKMYSKEKSLDNKRLDVNGHQQGIRLEPNDRRMVTLSYSWSHEMPNSLKKIGVRLLFKTTHENKKKTLKLKRDIIS